MTTSVQLSHLHPNRERRKNNCRFVHEKNIKRVLTSIVRYCIEIRILARTSTGLCWPTYPLTSYFLLPLASILDRTKKNGNDVLHIQKECTACIQKSVVRFQKRIGFCLRSVRTMECRKQKAKCAFVCMFNAQINCNTCPFRNVHQQQQKQQRHREK